VINRRRDGQVGDVGRGNKVTDLIRQGVEDGVFPGAVILVAKEGKVVYLRAHGHRAMIPEKSPMTKNTIFDLASLTKPLATTLVVMKMVEKGEIELDQKISGILPNASLGNKGDLTPRLLLSHSAGLADWKPFYERLRDYPMRDRKKMVRQWIIEEAFAYKPGTGNLYSDLGFMLIEWIVEERTGENLVDIVRELFYQPLGLKRTLFITAQEDPSRSSVAEGGEEDFAATEECPIRKRVLRGEVHDDNAWALGGYSGHAGLFSTCEEIYTIVNMLREHYLGTRFDFFKPETIREFWRRQDLVEGSDWALGWDTRALKGSSAGKYFSRNSVGHTGYTGTSIWMDLKKDVLAVFLSNRVHPTRNNEKIKLFRPMIHDAIMEELGLTSA
jgi:CubicO group peptidase (beta-lactamase class C family)